MGLELHYIKRWRRPGVGLAPSSDAKWLMAEALKELKAVNKQTEDMKTLNSQNQALVTIISSPWPEKKKNKRSEPC